MGDSRAFSPADDVRCLVPTCGVQIVYGHFFCMRHWKKLTTATQDRLCAAWRSYLRGKHGSNREWREARRVAIAEAEPQPALLSA